MIDDTEEAEMWLLYFLVRFSSPFCKNLALKLRWSAIKFLLSLVHTTQVPVIENTGTLTSKRCANPGNNDAPPLRTTFLYSVDETSFVAWHAFTLSMHISCRPWSCAYSPVTIRPILIVQISFKPYKCHNPVTMRERKGTACSPRPNNRLVLF